MTNLTKLGILKTGSPPATLSAFGSYPAMFRSLLGDRAYDYVVYDAEAGELPATVRDCAAYVVTGSPSDAYADLPWILALKRFLREAKGEAALVGICFGHQIMAEAFGGKVAKSDKGWGIGSHTYRVTAPEPWSEGQSLLTLPASHQDQVVELPPAAAVVAGSDFCPYGLLVYRDQPAFSLQLHPEFDADYAAALIETKRGTGPSEAEVDAALASARGPNDNALAAGWIRRFLEMSMA